MKKLTLFLLILIFSPQLFSQQNAEEKESLMRPVLWLGIWDFQHSTKAFGIDSMGFGDLSDQIEYRGTIVEAVRWTDSTGMNVLLLTQTGAFKYKDADGEMHDRAEIYAYLYVSKDKGNTWVRRWKMFDFTECYAVDMYAGFFARSMTITDMDKDGIAEITLLYKHSCRGDVSPSTKKLIMYENSDKYAIRGETVICNENDPKSNYGGSSKADESLKAKKDFYDFATKRWNLFTCDDFKQFR